MTSLYTILGIFLLIQIGRYLFHTYFEYHGESHQELFERKVSSPSSGSSFGKYEHSLYEKVYLMTRREALFFRKLSEILRESDYIICPKVRMEDIVGVSSYHGFRPWKVSGQIDRSHIDFILIGKSDLKTKYALELDDSTHMSYLAQRRDKMKDEAFKHTHIPLIRFDDPNVTSEIVKTKGIV